jgi:cytidylate kinase
MLLVTLSASYGAGGSWVGPEVARRLGVPFVDRAIPTTVAERLALPLEEALERDEAPTGVLDRLLRSLSPLTQFYAGGVTVLPDLQDARYCRATEEVIREHAARGGGVILGRAAMVVLRDDPHALHVRLDGPQDRRVEQAMRVEGVDGETARRRLAQADRAREAYVRGFYGVDVRNPTLFHLMIDATAIPLEAVVELVVTAARAREGAQAAAAALTSS